MAKVLSMLEAIEPALPRSCTAQRWRLAVLSGATPEPPFLGPIDNDPAPPCVARREGSPRNVGGPASDEESQPQRRHRRRSPRESETTILSVEGHPPYRVEHINAINSL